MLGAGAQSVIGIEPTLLYFFQFLALNHFANQSQACVLPLTLEDLGSEVRPFDTVFSMGVLLSPTANYWYRRVDTRKCVTSGLYQMLSN